MNLDLCKFPSNGDFILVEDIHKLFPPLRDFIVKEWEGEDKREALFLIDNLYLGPKKQGMTLDIVSTIPSEHISKDFQAKLDRLIREYNVGL